MDKNQKIKTKTLQLSIEISGLGFFDKSTIFAKTYKIVHDEADDDDDDDDNSDAEEQSKKSMLSLNVVNFVVHERQFGMSENLMNLVEMSLDVVE